MLAGSNMTITLIASVRLGDAGRMRFYPQAQGPSLYPCKHNYSPLSRMDSPDLSDPC